MSEQPSVGVAHLGNLRNPPPPHPTIQELMLKEQRRTNELLELLIQALADEGAGEIGVEVTIERDLSGKPIKHPTPSGGRYG